MSRNDNDLDQGFVLELSEAQLPLRSYIWKLLGNRHDAEDVLQKTNLVIWDKRMDWDPETVFLKWAYRIAYFQSKAFLRDHGRNPEKYHFDDQLLDLLAQEEPDFSERGHLLDALDTCLEKMDTDKRGLLMRRYEKTHSVEEIAEDQGYTANTLSQMLRRLRSRLSSCIEQELQSS